jgi:EAL domain-containing protein (putative c-di-GMP-specific phosphodiesterase class I)
MPNSFSISREMYLLTNPAADAPENQSKARSCLFIVDDVSDNRLILSALASAGLALSRLKLEINESVLLEQSERNPAILN